MTNVLFTQVAEWSIEEIEHHLAQHLSRTQSQIIIDQLIDYIDDRLSTYPLSAPISPNLLELGINKYRELIYEDYRILYQYSDGDVVINLILHQRQGIQKQLINYCLLPPI